MIAGKILPLTASKSIWRPVKGDEMAQNGGLRPSPYSVFLHESCRYPLTGYRDGKWRGYRDGKWRFAHAAQIRTEHGYRDLADRAAWFGLTRWLYAQCWTGTERPSALFDRATTWMLAHKVLLPGATTLERFVAKLRHRVDVRVWRVLASGISPPQQRRLEDLLRVPDGGRSSSLVTLRTGAAMVSGPALVRALERLNAVRSLSITVPAAAAIAPTRIAALARFAENVRPLARSLRTG